MSSLARQMLATGAGCALALGGCAVGFAQSQGSTNGAQGAQPQASTDAAQGAQPQHTLQLVQARAELDTSLDAKKAKQGEMVKAKLTDDVKIPDAQELPKNTVLEGHVDQVMASQHKSDSSMVVTFDHAKLKDGQELPIKATVMAISEPAMPAEEGGGAAPGGGMPSGGGVPSGGGAASGGERGGGAASGSAQSMPSPPMNTPQAESLPQQAQGQVGVPNVTLTSNIHEHSSATFLSKGRNVHVPDGTLMEVAIAVVPPGVHLR